MGKKTHSVKLDEKRCIGCTECIKRCPTEAIRVRNGKAKIVGEKCIDCGLCIKVCRNLAKKAQTEPMSVIEGYAYKVAIPAPTLYGQFKNIYDVNVLLTGLKRLGFDEVFEVSRAAEMVTEAAKEYLEKNSDLKKPIISSACPAIVRLISMRFPTLLDNVLPVISPVEVAAIAAKNYLVRQGMKREDIGVFFISPCAAKNTYIHEPLGLEKSEVDAVISMQDIYMKLRSVIRRLQDVEILAQSTDKGVDWALTGGESKGIYMENAIAVDGVENVIRVLEEVENGQLPDVEFIEGLACTGGCVGGPLTMVNSFVAKNHLRQVEKLMKEGGPSQRRDIDFNADGIDFEFTREIQQTSVLKLDEDVLSAIKKMEDVDRIYSSLPQIDCSSCGSPTCRAFAEDIVQGYALTEDCLFMLRKKVKELAEAMVDLSSKLPQTISHADEHGVSKNAD